MTERTRIGIEALLRWAYRQELPKTGADGLGLRVGPEQFGRAWGGLERYGDLLTLIDAPTNRWGVVPDLGARVEPHPDAIRVAEAVAALDDRGLDLPEGWDPLEDMAGVPEAGPLLAATVGRAIALATVVERDGSRRLKATPGWLVVRHAILADDGPDWEGEVPAVAAERHANGTPKWFVREVISGEAGPYEVEADGFDRKRRIPKPGAYRRTYLDPDPTDVAVSRASYEAWRVALDILTEALNGLDRTDAEGRIVGRGLDRWTVIPSVRSARPWIVPDPSSGRVLADLSGGSARSLGTDLSAVFR